ncbi:sporulation protein [Aneurinibacillus uraniidurans]|uniref:sporulation protein n=1 Tax=Aneurinibacillus uraniidurans TaxID=2966586 RepID=UPI002349D6D7|nr:sporulation protein [Aneurinibacillus sp. B1]WCN37948.1 sporulation protein [Aneurinibacillus sp. B1]
MFKKFLSKIGIGGASVNLVLYHDTVRMGDTITGELIVQGGDVEQRMNGITVELHVKSRYVYNDTTTSVDKCVATVQAATPFTLGVKETKTFPFECQIPKFIAMSSITTRYYFKTNLDIESALDSNDRDFLTILPSGLMRNFVEGLDLLGCKVRGEAFTGSVQILDLRTTHWLVGKLDELVFQFDPAASNQVMTGHFEIDKKTSGLYGKMMDKLDLDEVKGYYSFNAIQLETPGKAADTIQKFVENHYSRLLG